MSLKTTLILLPLVPLAGFLFNGILSRIISDRIARIVAISTSGFTFGLALLSWFLHHQGPAVVEFDYFTWISSGSFRIVWCFYLDPLSMLMVLLVSGVGFLIHVYSTGYMTQDDGQPRFFAYLNLFLTAMLILVLAGNYWLIFIGWEGVGLCSYLLIGFYFNRQSAGNAGKKAFIVNRIGDTGFVLGLLLMWATFQTVDFNTLFSRVATMPVEATMGVLTTITTLLFVGAMGKSAQVPLHIWLPDAMEGPTPVSALIHAATMVTAGVYLMVRTHPLLARSPHAMLIIGIVGVLTALLAGWAGVFQRDIKRILAYSTVSQLGFMFAALSVGAYSAGIFHLMTHAFFKALLFLGAGSVIMALHHEQDIARMGGLFRHLPLTAFTMWVGTAAIAGIPLFSGFFSKDEILFNLASAQSGHSLLMYVLASFSALLTAIYMGRMMILTFHGPLAADGRHFAGVKEAPWSMRGVLVILAILSMVAGLLGLPSWLGVNVLEHYLAPVFQSLPPTHRHLSGDHTGEIRTAIIASVLAALGLGTAWWMYRRHTVHPDNEYRLGMPWRLGVYAFYMDDIYQRVVVQPVHWFSRTTLWYWMDVRIIDGVVNGLGRLTVRMGVPLAAVQNGQVQWYLVWILAGVVGLSVTLCSVVK